MAGLSLRSELRNRKWQAESVSSRSTATHMVPESAAKHLENVAVSFRPGYVCVKIVLLLLCDRTKRRECVWVIYLDLVELRQAELSQTELLFRLFLASS